MFPDVWGQVELTSAAGLRLLWGLSVFAFFVSASGIGIAGLIPRPGVVVGVVPLWKFGIETFSAMLPVKVGNIVAQWMPFTNGELGAGQYPTMRPIFGGANGSLAYFAIIASVFFVLGHDTAFPTRFHHGLIGGSGSAKCAFYAPLSKDAHEDEVRDNVGLAPGVSEAVVPFGIDPRSDVERIGVAWAHRPEHVDGRPRTESAAAVDVDLIADSLTPAFVGGGGDEVAVLENREIGTALRGGVAAEPGADRVVVVGRPVRATHHGDLMIGMQRDPESGARVHEFLGAADLRAGAAVDGYLAVVAIDNDLERSAACRVVPRPLEVIRDPEDLGACPDIERCFRVVPVRVGALRVYQILVERYRRFVRFSQYVRCVRILLRQSYQGGVERPRDRGLFGGVGTPARGLRGGTFDHAFDRFLHETAVLGGKTR
ncbi:hypothetical protein ACWF82_07125 [Nocardia sp. NPDC055053]